MVGSTEFPPDNTTTADILTLRSLSLILVFGGILALIIDPPSVFLVFLIVITFWLLSALSDGGEEG